MKIACGVAYQGQAYCGWQKQAEVTAVQNLVESALSKVAAHDVTVQCAGRTDAGVHATSQVIHFESQVKRNRGAWILGTNTHLPDDIRITWAKPVINAFHARFEAMSRQYHYLIDNHPVHLPFYQGLCSHYSQQLNETAMHEAAQSLLGEHDFSAFRAASCQSTSKHRHVFSASVSRQGRLLMIEITANAFLHHMVRNIVGTLLEIGSGRQAPNWMAEILASRDRTLAGATAAAAGLYLTRVQYPDIYELPEPVFQLPWVN